jgi:hypothetical protein
MTARCKLCRCVHEVDEDGFCFQCSEDIKREHLRGDEAVSIDNEDYYEHQKQEDENEQI